MSKPHIHAVSSAKKYGGVPEDYIDIHNWFDQTKAHVADARHRALLHNSFGCFLAEQVFGETRINSAKLVYSVRDVAEQHIIEDLGWIPSVQDYLTHMSMETWMYKRKLSASELNKQLGPSVEQTNTQATTFTGFPRSRPEGLAD